MHKQLVAGVERLLPTIASLPQTGEVVAVDVVLFDVPHQFILAGEVKAACFPPALVHLRDVVFVLEPSHCTIHTGALH